jgi:hypothetical protein
LLGFQALVLKRERGRRADAAHELGLVDQRRIVDQRREYDGSVVLDRGDRAPGIRRGQLDRVAVGIDVAGGLG